MAARGVYEPFSLCAECRSDGLSSSRADPERVSRRRCIGKSKAHIIELVLAFRNVRPRRLIIEIRMKRVEISADRPLPSHSCELDGSAVYTVISRHAEALVAPNITEICY